MTFTDQAGNRFPKLRAQHPLRWLMLPTLISVLVACAPSGASTTTSSQPAAPAAPKVLTLVGREGLIVDLPGQAGRTNLGNASFVHDQLVVKDASDAVISRAAEAISVDKGTWKLNPDGSMDTIWKLRPNVKWQDGTPFTADDMMFTYTLYKDPDLPSRYGEPLKLMTRAEVVDPLTFSVHWSEPYAAANEAPALIPLSKHLLLDQYTRDKSTFGDTTFYHRDFVGLGAYKIVDWQPGSHVEFGRFDDYYLGRPLLDKVILRFMSDSNTIVANLLTGTVDMVFDKDSVDTEAALEVRRRWEGTGSKVHFFPSFRVISVEIQFKPEFARPTNGLTNRDVRQALTHAVDRVALNDAVTQGLSPLADSYIAPHHTLAPVAAPAAPKYPYDVNRAKQLLAQAGWTTTGPDGVLVHATTGERFETDLWNRFSLQKDQAIVADNWKAVGVQANVKQLPQTRDRELETKITGGQMMDQTVTDYTYNGRIGTLNLATAANRYTGRNIGGYSNPKVDELLAKLLLTIDARETANIQRDIVREAFTDVALIPFYFQITPALVREGVTGPEGGTVINFYQWDKKS
jgi:peptide/nickel transport system substrate-binding protein